MTRPLLHRAIVIAAALALATAQGAAGAVSHNHPIKHPFGHGTSTNWSGYAIDGSGATSVTATWVQAASQNCASVPKSWSSPWVGIDGDNSKTVEQVGTDSDCTRGTAHYYAWWEMYPKKTEVIRTMTVQPGDQYTGTVSYAPSGRFTLTLTDDSTGASFTTVQPSKAAQRSSVEWIVEGPSNGNLTDFGTVAFTNASATIGGATVSPSTPGADPITMVTSNGAARATPSAAAGGGFAVAWNQS